MRDAAKISETDDTFGKIERYYHSTGTLTPKEKEICERWELVFALFLEHRNRKVTISKYIALQKTKGNEVSLAQAYRDLKAAEKLFTPMTNYSKEFLRLILIESALKDIKECDRRARKSKTTREWTMIMQIKEKNAKIIIEAKGLNMNDGHLPDFSKLHMKSFEINVAPHVLNVFERLKGGAIDVTKMVIDSRNTQTLNDDEIEMDN